MFLTGSFRPMFDTISHIDNFLTTFEVKSKNVRFRYLRYLRKVTKELFRVGYKVPILETLLKAIIKYSGTLKQFYNNSYLI